MKPAVWLIGALVLLSTQTTFARNEYLRAFSRTYPKAASLRKCAVCHGGGEGFLNYYGMDFRQNNYDFKAIEPLDSDGDQVSNLDEITRQTLPGIKDTTPTPEPSPAETPAPECPSPPQSSVSCKVQPWTQWGVMNCSLFEGPITTAIEVQAASLDECKAKATDLLGNTYEVPGRRICRADQVKVEFTSCHGIVRTRVDRKL